MEFQILDSKKYPLHVRAFTKQEDLLNFWRFEHRATVGWNTREFMVFVDQVALATYIEEISGGHLEKVTDDSLHTALTNFAFRHGYMEATPPIPKKIR